ncbi:AAA family ATPase [Candidatus Woesearchaeota archaeon]|jgi:archaeal cell division control protein 6|nr:AAA family ATPase [Candidatus Woesearchaeota archaeon]MBT3538260.1 AAA family ATPase [Candidatus Woesearchaeota archaeon]MBT4697164.1 AAA family ATPase [Candidatus Woesearchaeota archaeon]MBT4717426.1 AAA family ATPase [Candidatus Woesearchaeota archaeon]MBT7105929.1 AAA family ATPase [Candidatus Woesearchaeota archaeon]
MKKGLTFAGVIKNKIFKKRDVLYSLVPPNGFLHRVEQKNDLIMELSPILMSSAVSCIFVYGNPGTGKTGLVHELMDELQTEAENSEVDLRTIYVNCSENRTETAILLEILNSVNSAKEYPRMGWTRAKAISEFNKIMSGTNSQVLIVLDEVDYVLREEGDDILYRLSRINSNTKASVSTLIISNDIRVSDYIKPRTQSSIGRVKVIFAPYAEDELYDILKDRAKVAFEKSVVADAVVRKIAEIEAQRNGDARRALEMLDSCAKIALAKKRDKISLDLVDEADSSLERDQILNIAATLTKHQKLVYLGILKNIKNIQGGSDVYKYYLQTCESYNIKPLSERRVRSFVVSLTDLGLIQSEVGWLSDEGKKTRKIAVVIDGALKNKAIKLLRDSL